jgi:hypothetical protein
MSKRQRLYKYQIGERVFIRSGDYYGRYGVILRDRDIDSSDYTVKFETGKVAYVPYIDLKPAPPVEFDVGETVVVPNGEFGLTNAVVIYAHKHTYKRTVQIAKAKLLEVDYHCISRPAKAPITKPASAESIVDPPTAPPEMIPTIPKATPVSDKPSVESSESTKILQSHVAARFDCIDPVVLKLLAECLGFGAAKYYPFSYHRIPVDDHINHALNHINEHRRLSQETRIDPTDEMHLVNALARITFAISCLAQQGKYPTTYSHPEQNK